MAQPDPPEDALSQLRRRVDAARQEGAPQTSPPPDSAASLALRFGGEFGSAILVGALIGIGADHFLHVEPWGLMVGLALGFSAGVLGVVRAARAYSAKHPPQGTRVADDEES